MFRSAAQLRDDALRIWHAGLDAVRSDRLIRDAVHVDGHWLELGDERLDLREVSKIAVVGAGKAGAGMAQALEEVSGEGLLDRHQVTGWVNVPENCVRQLSRIRLHAARPAARNEPTAEGVAGSAEILRIVGHLGPSDLCLCLLSGGASALMPSPAPGISLADKLAVTRHLGAAGANIQELNTVRKQLSGIKGGGLARACRAGRLISLIVSDVLGDPLDVIGSGPTVPDGSTPVQALTVLRKFDTGNSLPPAVLRFLERRPQLPARPPACRVENIIIGNNAVAVDAAGIEAERLGYSHAMLASPTSEGEADAVGQHLAEIALKMRGEPGPDCLIWGGEPVVTLAANEARGLGGRNQQLVLAALERLLKKVPSNDFSQAAGLAILSGGTDGEDGPTDAAGALLDESLLAAMLDRGLDPGDYLRRNDAYRFFEPLGGLIKTGPTDTNVCDVRVAVVSRAE